MKLKAIVFVLLTAFVPLVVYSFTPEDIYYPQPENGICRSWLRLMSL